MGLDLDYIDGQTPLDEEEKDGLLIPSIATRGELDEFEQQNIEQAVLSSRKPFLVKRSSAWCTNVCMVMYGLGQVIFAKPIRT